MSSPTTSPDAARQTPFPLPKFNMQELYNPTMVTIKANDSDVVVKDYYERTFTVQRELICRHSSYFRGLFEGGFTEASKQTATITNFHPNIFETFMDYLFHNEISQDGDDPVEWVWEYLFSCYIFGDKYDSRGFRDRVLEAIQTKLGARIPRSTTFPKSKDLKVLWDNTASTDRLRRLLIDAYITEYEIGDDEDKDMLVIEQTPSDFIGRSLISSQRRSSYLQCAHCSPDGDGQACSSTKHTGLERRGLTNSRWCQYHQHENEEEKRVCLWRRSAIEWKFMDPPPATTEEPSNTG